MSKECEECEEEEEEEECEECEKEEEEESELCWRRTSTYLDVLTTHSIGN